MSAVETFSAAPAPAPLPRDLCPICGERLPEKAVKCLKCDSLQEPMRSCRSCREPIPLRASKCKHCDAFQDLRRFFPFSSTILSLLIALFSVMSSAAPVVKAWLTRDTPPSAVVSALTEGNQIELAVWNRSSERMQLRDFTLSVPELGITAARLEVPAGPARNGLFIAAGETATVPLWTAALESQQREPADREDKARQARAALTVTYLTGAAASERSSLIVLRPGAITDFLDAKLRYRE